MKNRFGIVLLVLVVFAFGAISFQQGDPTALEIIKKADEKVRGKSSKAQLKMTIVRPTWKREMIMKSWSLGDEKALILVTSPARDKGTAFLKRQKEMWNWQPTIDRVIKMPPSMMSQSWMGSDFNNDDLVKQSSIVVDYTHKLQGTETIDGRECWKIELTPKADAAVVWGKILSWISKDEYLQLKTEFYDEDGYLINTMIGKNIKNLGGLMLPSLVEVIPEEEEGNRTIMEYISLEFDIKVDDSFFSVQNMKRVR